VTYSSHPRLLIDLLSGAHAIVDAPDRQKLQQTAERLVCQMTGSVDATLLLLDGDQGGVFDDIAATLGLTDINETIDGIDDLRATLAPINGRSGCVTTTTDDVDVRRMLEALFGDHAVLACAVHSDGGLQGILAAIDSRTTREFSLDDELVVQEIATFAGQILHRDAISSDRGARDGLTGLFDSAYLRNEMRVELERAKRVGTTTSLVIFDIDHFKNVNDTEGHLAGDGVLRQFAAFVSDHQRSTDLAVRYGGEEFAILLPGTTEEGAFVLAERLRGSIESVSAGSWNLWTKTITVSCGVASLGPGNTSTDPDTLIAAADKALYHSKRNGRNRSTKASQLTD
jgi:diguanylate cyclase (GGDEF)-like protein